jgi:amino acid adenylation domain-containing protein
MLAKVDRSGGWPLSFGQQRLWILARLAPENPFYHMDSVMELTGTLDVGALERAVAEVVSRHEVLRSRIEVIDGVPMQFVGESAALEVVEVSGDGAQERAREVVANRAQRPFDLSLGPLIRVCLVRLSQDEHVLAMTLHHIAADAWSIGVLRAELQTLYTAFAAGLPSPLPTLPVQYGDFAVWQRDWLNGERLESGLRFWRQELAGAALDLDLPLDRARPRISSYQGSSVQLRLDAAVTTTLKRMARREHATLLMVLLAAFGVLLVRWTGQEDVLVGVPTAGRVHRNLEGLIGFFVNTLVMRLRSTGDPTFAELLRRVRETALDVFQHQDLPFEVLVEELNPERDLGRNPLVQVTFQLDKAPVRRPSGQTSLEAKPFARNMNTRNHFDLSVRMTEAGENIYGEIKYATDVFRKDTIERLAQSYLRILRQVTEDPARQVSALTLADPPEPLSAPDKGSAISAGVADQTIGGLFVRQAHRTPDAVAVACENRCLTYSGLRLRVNRLARYLRRRGVGPEVIVGLCLERSIEMVVAVLGIIEAGGAYVPLDPELPPNRVSKILEDSEVPVVVTTSGLAGRFDFEGQAVVRVDRDRDLVATEADADLVDFARPDNLLYVLYTSGSTGQPKGVMVRHAHVVDYVMWCLEHLPIADGGAVPLTSSISFAGVTLALFGSLVSGRCLVVPSQTDIFSWCTSYDRCSFVKLTPSALRYAHRRFGRCWDGWGSIILASEPVRHRDLELLRTASDVIPAIHYGTTETSGSTLRQPLIGEAPTEELLVGRPVSTTQVLVLDRWGEPVPPGVPGEVFIGGPSIARGYLGQPALTAERFVPNAFGAPGSRLFRTGDRARWSPDGNLEFLGRADRQVKIHGFRVALDDVECQILALDDVADVAVTTASDPNGDPILAAYVSVEPGCDLSPDDLRSELEHRLPRYMVPVRLAIVADLPRTSGGKVDRSALAAIAVAAPVRGDPPLSADEQAMAAIWADVLHLNVLGRNDNFFAVGGHSLLAAQVLARVQDNLGVSLPFEVIFEAPTIAAFTRRVQQAGQQQDEEAAEQLIEHLTSLSDDEVDRMLRTLDEQ